MCVGVYVSWAVGLFVMVFLAAGLYFCFKKLTDANIFIILYGVTSIYFAVSIHPRLAK